MVERYGSLRLDVRYVGGRVQAVTARSAADVAANGVRVGISAAQLHRLVPKLTCVGALPSSTA